MEITIDNYMIATLANWTEVGQDEFEKLKQSGRAHLTSESGSEYFELDGMIYRKSDHWHAAIAGCSWFIDGKTISRMVYGKCKLTDFKPLSLEHAKQLNLSQTSMKGLIHIQSKRESSCQER